MSNKTLVEQLRELAVGSGSQLLVAMEKFNGNGSLHSIFATTADRIEREYLPRPCFEDGEPVKVGDEIDIDSFRETKRVEDMTVYIKLDDNSGTFRKVLKRPEPEVLGADGVPIRKGDTVYLTKQNGAIRPLEVKGFNYGYVLVAYRDRNPDEEQGDWNSYLGAQLTHKQPDSLERIEEDAGKGVCDYFAEQDGRACESCCGALYNECRRDMMLDLLNRQREVLEEQL